MAVAASACSLNQSRLAAGIAIPVRDRAPRTDVAEARGRRIDSIHGGGALGIRQDVDLAVRLLEWLHDGMSIQPLAPLEHDVRRAAARMPQPHARCRRQPVERPVARVHDSAVETGTEIPAFAFGELPNEAAGHLTDQRMFRIALAPERSRGIRDRIRAIVRCGPAGRQGAS